jgi:hypothetical protein
VLVVPLLSATPPEAGVVERGSEALKGDMVSASIRQIGSSRLVSIWWWALRSPHRYVLPPGTGHGLHNIFIWAVVKMLHPGQYSSLGSTVSYTQQGTQYRDFVKLGFNGSVGSNAAWPAVVNEKGCLNTTHPLNPGHE